MFIHMSDLPQDQWRGSETGPREGEYHAAALTMPLEHINCNRGPEMHYGINKDFMTQFNISRALDHMAAPYYGCPVWSETAGRTLYGCCYAWAAQMRNQLLGMPARWIRVDFAALTNESRPTNIVHDNWHYQCGAYIDPPVNLAGRRTSYSKLCVHNRLLWLGDKQTMGVCHNQTVRAWLETATQVNLLPRENGDCGEAGNTQLWQHMVDHVPGFWG